MKEIKNHYNCIKMINFTAIKINIENWEERMLSNTWQNLHLNYCR